MNNHTSLPKKPRLFYGYVIVGVACFVLALTSGTLYSYGVFLKPVAAEFGVGRAVTSGVYSMCLIVMGLLFMLSGRLTDRFGPRVVLSICGGLLGIGYILMSQISAVWQLYLVFGGIVGIGQSGGLIPMMTTVTRWFVRRRGVMTGIVVAGVGLGQFIVPPIATQLIDKVGWRNTFAIIGGAILVLVPLAAQFLKRDPGQMGLSALGSDVAKKAQPANFDGLSRGQALRTRQFWMLITMYFAHGFYSHGTLVHIVPYATDAGISPVTAAGILAAIGGLGVIGRLVMGSAGDRVGNRPAVIVAYAFALIAFSWLHFARVPWMLYLFAFFFGFAYAGLVTLEAPLVAETFGLKAHGAILGVVHLGATSAGSISPFFAGYVFDRTGGYTLAFLVFAIMSIIGMALIWSFKPARLVTVPRAIR